MLRLTLIDPLLAFYPVRFRSDRPAMREKLVSSGTVTNYFNAVL